MPLTSVLLRFAEGDKWARIGLLTLVKLTFFGRCHSAHRKLIFLFNLLGVFFSFPCDFLFWFRVLSVCFCGFFVCVCFLVGFFFWVCVFVSLFVGVFGFGVFWLVPPHTHTMIFCIKLFLCHFPFLSFRTARVKTEMSFILETFCSEVSNLELLSILESSQRESEIVHFGSIC